MCTWAPTGCTGTAYHACTAHTKTIMHKDPHEQIGAPTGILPGTGITIKRHVKLYMYYCMYRTHVHVQVYVHAL